ncbi:MAG: DUF485 domain-containing protein [Kineosporiaceae bacterium]|nr:DUF485 domain-containing protein [Kineosporiaceae bacterium]
MATLDDANRPVLQRAHTDMVRARHRLVIPMVVGTLAFFFLQQVLTNFTSVLDGLVFDGMTWAYVYAFAQFFFVVILTTIYRRRMQQLEAQFPSAAVAGAAAAAHYDDWTTMETHQTAAEGDGDEQFEHVQGTRLDEEDGR